MSGNEYLNLNSYQSPCGSLFTVIQVMNNIEQYFQSKDLYLIFGVEKIAPVEEIKKSYRKLALKHHPDKGGNEEAFKCLCMIYEVLSNSEKRSIYDEQGWDGILNLDNDHGDSEKDYEYWYSFYRNLFPKINVNDIEKYKNDYVGSQEQKNDIIEAYQKYDGDIEKILEWALFIEAGEECELCRIIDEAIDSGDIEETDCYKQMKGKYINNTKSGGKKRKTTKKSAKSTEDLDSLAAMIRNKNSTNSNAFDAILKKYEDNSDMKKKRRTTTKQQRSDEDEEDIPDDEFEKIQQKLLSNKKTKKTK